MSSVHSARAGGMTDSDGWILKAKLLNSRSLQCFLQLWAVVAAVLVLLSHRQEGSSPFHLCMGMPYKTPFIWVLYRVLSLGIISEIAQN